jgi:hypothetical protein
MQKDFDIYYKPDSLVYMKQVYLIVKRDETGRVFETRVPQDELAEHLDHTFKYTSYEVVAVIRLLKN